MAKKKCPDCEECLPAWLAAFGDLMSLLLCFFVLLLSMSSMDAKKVSEAIGSLSGAMSVLEGGMKTEISKKRIQESTPIDAQDETSEVVNKIAAAVMDSNEMQEKGKGPAVQLEEAENGFVIKLPAELLFKKGSAIIENEDAILFLKRIALIIQELPAGIETSVQGHTDNSSPGKNSSFRDNWELSSARAIAVLRELLTDGVSPKHIDAAAFAEFRPIATNATEKGRKENRRVEIRFFGTKPENSSKVQSVLESSK